METLVFLYFHVCDGPYRPMPVLAHAVSRCVRLTLADGEWVSVPRLSSFIQQRETMFSVSSQNSLSRTHTYTDTPSRANTLRHFMMLDAHRMRNRKEKYVFFLLLYFWLYCTYSTWNKKGIPYMRSDVPVGFIWHVPFDLIRSTHYLENWMEIFTAEEETHANWREWKFFVLHRLTNKNR